MQILTPGWQQAQLLRETKPVLLPAEPVVGSGGG